MENSNNSSNSKQGTSLITKRMATGASVAFVIAAIFLYTVNNPDPTWGKFWILRPLIVVPLAGAMGGLFFHLMDFLRVRGGWKTIAANLIGIIGYLIIFWMGSILGLAGTLWD